MPIARTSISIAAPPAVVWGVLTDTARWPEWNPSQPGFKVPLKAGARGRIAVASGSRVRWVPIRMVSVVPERTLSWRGGVRGVFHAVHGFDLMPEGSGTRVDHVEIFSGVIPHLAWAALQRRLMPRYRAVNAALRERCLA